MLDVQIINGNDLADVLDRMSHKARADVMTNIKYMDVAEYDKEIHLVLRDGQKIVGDVGLQLSPYQPRNLWIKHLSVHNAHQGKGYGRILVKAILEYAKDNGLLLEPSSFTEMGMERLAPLFVCALEENPDLFSPCAYHAFVRQGLKPNLQYRQAA